tara:strand:- start:2297 stop:2752 length:456 start_codon:yes stop_codon:yes gene_type:complete
MKRKPSTISIVYIDHYPNIMAKIKPCRVTVKIPFIRVPIRRHSSHHPVHCLRRVIGPAPLHIQSFGTAHCQIGAGSLFSDCSDACVALAVKKRRRPGEIIQRSCVDLMSLLALRNFAGAQFVWFHPLNGGGRLKAEAGIFREWDCWLAFMT